MRAQRDMRAMHTTNGAKRGAAAWTGSAPCAGSVGATLVATLIHPRGVSGGRPEEADS